MLDTGGTSLVRWMATRAGLGSRLTISGSIGAGGIAMRVPFNSCRSVAAVALILGILLAVIFCTAGIASADDEVDVHAAYEQGMAFQQKGDYAAAAKAYAQALELALRVLGEQREGTTAIVNNLAAVHQNMGHYAQAELLYQRSLKIVESNVGPNDPRVAQILNNLAELYRNTGQYAKAEPLYQRSLKIRESQLGPDHPDIGQSLNCIALLYCKMGQYAKAEPLYQRCLKIFESNLGAESSPRG